MSHAHCTLVIFFTKPVYIVSMRHILPNLYMHSDFLKCIIDTLSWLVQEVTFSFSRKICHGKRFALMFQQTLPNFLGHLRNACKKSRLRINMVKWHNGVDKILFISLYIYWLNMMSIFLGYKNFSKIDEVSCHFFL